MPHGIAHIGPDVGIQMRPAIGGNNANIVHHLIANGYVTRRLHNFQSVPIDHGKDGSGHAARDAAIVIAPVRPSLGTAKAHGVSLVVALLALRSKGWDAAIRRIDYLRSLVRGPARKFAPVSGNGRGIDAAKWTLLSRGRLGCFAFGQSVGCGFGGRMVVTAGLHKFFRALYGLLAFLELVFGESAARAEFRRPL